MCNGCEREFKKRNKMVSVIKKLAEEKLTELEMKLVKLLGELSKGISLTCDLELAKELTRIIEDLTLHNLKFMKGLAKKVNQDLKCRLENVR